MLLSMRRLNPLFLLPLAVSCAFVINLCSWIYQCGCRGWWSGAAEHCNIHMTGVRHCPWCCHGDLGFSLVLLLILIPQVVLMFWPGNRNWRLRLLASFLVFPVWGGLIAAALGIADGYWS